MVVITGVTDADKQISARTVAAEDAEFSWAPPEGYPDVDDPAGSQLWHTLRWTLWIIIPAAIALTIWLAGSPFASAAGGCGGG